MEKTEEVKETLKTMAAFIHVCIVVVFIPVLLSIGVSGLVFGDYDKAQAVFLLAIMLRLTASAVMNSLRDDDTG